MKKFEIDIETKAVLFTTLTVQANSEAEARQAALKRAAEEMTPFDYARADTDEPWIPDYEGAVKEVTPPPRFVVVPATNDSGFAVFDNETDLSVSQAFKSRRAAEMVRDAFAMEYLA